MTMQLQPIDLADCFTLVEITARITAIMAAIAIAEQSLMDSFGDTQAQQKVQRQNLTELNNSLSPWIKAKNILNSTDSSTAELIAANYIPDRCSRY